MLFCLLVKVNKIRSHSHTYTPFVSIHHTRKDIYLNDDLNFIYIWKKHFSKPKYWNKYLELFYRSFAMKMIIFAILYFHR